MNMKKKVSLLMALAMCGTIGGVYATWTYSGSDDIIDTTYEAKVQLTNATTEGAMGVYEIVSNVQFFVDQASDAHDTVLRYATKESTNSSVTELDEDDTAFTITFTPKNSTATDEVKANGVESWFTLSTTTTMQYGGTDIFTFTPPTGTHGHEITWDRSISGEVITFTYKVTVEQLKDLMGMNNFVLDTKAEYDTFHSSLGGNIEVTVTDGKTTA